MRKIWDFLGMITSVLCVIHCVALPVIALLLPTVAAYFSGDATHQIFFGILLWAGAFALVPGYRMHRKLRPIAWLLVGLILMTGATFYVHDLLSHAWEPIIAILGSMCLIRAHYLNHKLCGHCDQHRHFFMSNEKSEVSL